MNDPRPKKRIKIKLVVEAYIDRDEWAAEYGVTPDKAREDVANWFGELAEAGGHTPECEETLGPLPLPHLATLTRAQAKVTG